MLSVVAPLRGETPLPGAAAAAAERGGVCLIIRGDGARAARLAGKTPMFVVALVKGDACPAARGKLDAAGLLGARAAALPLSSGGLPFPDGYANLILLEQPVAGVTEKEIARALNPNGVAVVGGAIVKGRMPAGSDDWTHDRHDPGNSAVSRERNVRPPFRTQWIAGPSRASGAVTVVADGRLITQSVRKGYEGAPAILARDAFNGMPLWKRGLAGDMPLRRGLVAVGDKVYFIDKGERIVALDAATGRELKEYRMPADAGIAGRWLRLSVIEGVAYVHATGAADAKLDPRGLGPSGDALFAIRLADGRPLWTHRSAKPALERSIAIGDGVLAYYTPRLGAAAIDLKTGRDRWRNVDVAAQIGKGGATGWMTAGSWSVYHGGRFFFYAIGRTVALDSKTGKLLWTGKSARAPLCIGGKIYTYARGGRSVAVVDPASGKVTGSIKLPIAMTGCGSGTGSATCIYSAGQGFAALDLPTGSLHSYNAYRTPCGIGSTIANGLLFTTPFTCNCNWAVRGQISVAPAGPGWRPADPGGNLDERLIRGKAFDRPLAAVNPGAWPACRHDARRSARTDVKPALPLKLRWRRTLTGRLTPPSAGGGRVYVGSDLGHVRAIDAGGGEVRWTFRAGAGVPVTPVFRRGRVYAGSLDGWVYCLDAADGELVWKFRAAPTQRYIHVRGRMVSTYAVSGGVIVDDDRVYFAAGMFSYDGCAVYCLDAATGKCLYAKDIGRLGEAGGGVNPQGPLAADRTRLFIPTGGGHPAALTKSDGKPIWWRDVLRSGKGAVARYAKFNYSGGTELVVDGDALLVGGPRMIGDGGYPFIIRNADSGYPHGTQQAAKDGKAALARNGLLWEYYIPPTYGRSTGRSTPIITPDLVYCSSPKQITAYDRSELIAVHLAGKPNWPKAVAEAARFSVSGPPHSRSMVLAGGVLLATGPRELVALEPKPDGKRIGRITLPAAPVRNGIAVADGAVFVVTDDGALCRAN